MKTKNKTKKHLISYFKNTYHCSIAVKNAGSSHRDSNITIKLNHKIPVVFHNLINYDSHLIMQSQF